MNRTPNGHQKPPQKQPSIQGLGKGMYSVAWLLGIALLTLFFSDHEQRKINPNQNPETRVSQGIAEVVLQQNRQGHYITNGTINGTEVTFLLDTGATNVSVPAHIAEKIGLQKGYPQPTITANGTIRVYQSWIDELTIGKIVLRDIDANINPHVTDDFILLGMSALTKLEFTQRNDTLTLTTLH